MTTRDAQTRMRMFAGVIGPWLIIVPGIIVPRASAMDALAAKFFDDELFVWFTGALLLFVGRLIIAFHQYRSSVAAVMISLFGWSLALRGYCTHGRSQTVRARRRIYGCDISCATRVRCPGRDRTLSCLCGLACEVDVAISNGQSSCLLQPIPSRCWVSLTRRMLTLPLVTSISLRQHGFCASRQ
jgi:hypothetical protein